jgi:hypothetical protein
LEPILEDFQEPETYPLWAVLPPGRLQTPKVRVFLEFLVGHFGSAPWRHVSSSDQRIISTGHDPINSRRNA